MSREILTAVLASLVHGRTYEEIAAEYQALQEREARAWMLDRWQAFQTMKAARSGQPRPDRRLHRGPGLAPVRDDRVGQGPPRHGVVHYDRQPLRPDENLHGELKANPGAGAVLDGVKIVSHAPDSEAVPHARQAGSDAEKSLAGGLPAVASFW